MCGIVGYVGNKQAKNVLMQGLEKLEYRGYDSAGIALMRDGDIHIFKEKGRIETLKSMIPNEMDAPIGIGHTRWATHGAPTKINAHPHKSETSRFVIVHNGVIENHNEIRKNLLSDVTLVSETDTELIVQLVDKYVRTGYEVKEAFFETIRELHGSYAIALMDKKNANTIYVAKNKSPLLIGKGEGFNLVVSDAMAGIEYTKKYFEIRDYEVAIVTDEEVTIFNLKGEKVDRETFEANIDISDIEKGTYEDFMLKEIDEQAIVLRKIVQEYRNEENNIAVQEDILQALKKSDRIYIVAAGTSYHAGLIGKEYFEKIAKTHTEVHISSEFGYNFPLLSENPFFIFISQSGETADSRMVLKQVNEMGYPSLTVTNVKGSTLSREANFTLLLHAGPEIAVASTKAYTAQIAVLAILANALAGNDGQVVFEQLSLAANAVASILDNKKVYNEIAKEYLNGTRNAFFIGRSLDYYVSLEAALKLKEISYIQAEGFAGGELKHGTIALIEQNTPVIVLANQKDVNLNIRGNGQEVEARGANTCVIATNETYQEGDRVVLPSIDSLYQPIITVVPMQLISYYATKQRGYDVDKPRNLAKSVTVE